MSENNWLIVLSISVAAAMILGLFIGINYGWLSRIHYETIQCMNYGRCFH